MKTYILLFIMSLFIFTGCSSQNVIEEQHTQEISNLIEQNESEILEEIKEVELSLKEIRELEAQNLTSKIDELYGSDNNTLAYGLAFGCYSLRYLDGKEKVERCKELRKEIDQLSDKRHFIETNTKDIIFYSKEVVDFFPFNIEILNVNPTAIRFNIDQKKHLRLFVKHEDYECLYANKTFNKGENIVLNEKLCYLNDSMDITLLIENDNKAFSKEFKTDSRDFQFAKENWILSPSHPNLYGSNVTWELQIYLNNTNDTKYFFNGMKGWVSQRDVNGSYTDPDLIDYDPISNDLLLKKFDAFTLGEYEEKYLRWKFNYSDLPSPISWVEFEYYYEIK